MSPDLARNPRRKLAVVACMDARLDPVAALGLELGDAHVIRNAGGIVGDEELRALAISQRKLGTEEVVLIHHTDCGMQGFDDEGFRRALREETGEEPPWPPRSFDDVEASVRESRARVEACPFLLHTGSVRGFVYEVETGRLREVS